MVVKLRLMRLGKKRNPFYRIVAIDSKRARNSGRFLESVGTYDPSPVNYEGKRTKQYDYEGLMSFASNANTRDRKHIVLNTQRIKYWLSVGAQPTDTVKKLLGKANVLPIPPNRAGKSKLKEGGLSSSNQGME
eukprot:TRINITY_DN5326_c0_g1_i3.p1 TRINITY_DN5326_c0_g1~~TRINITY_DN5326_c0_g1_i3.p1  ORF type:complete len:145 (+),score=19.66 TRINITY_DN5326_c0_g1_i3:38-436(+)